MQSPQYGASPEVRPSLNFRTHNRSSRELILLAPSGAVAPRLFHRSYTDAEEYDTLLAEMQTLRGEVYLRDGAITPAQISGGRHRSAGDRESWYLLILDHDGHVCACSRYREHPRYAGFENMLVSNAALARCPRWGGKVARAVEQELAVGIGTATHRNGSASILRKLGARPLQHEDAELPSYHDPQYRCEMEILGFYFWAPNPRYAEWISEIRAELPNIRVIADCEAKPEWRFMKLSWDFSRVRPVLAASAA